LKDRSKERPLFNPLAELF